MSKLSIAPGSLVLIASLAAVATLAACVERPRNILTSDGGDDDDGRETTPGAPTTSASKTKSKGAGTTSSVGPLPTGITAKEYFTKNVHVALKSCGSCHDTGPGPAWLLPGDAARSYDLVFGRGYIIRESTLLRKGAHAGGAGPALNADQSKTVATWIELELEERGDKAPPSVLERIGDCLDQKKFDAIGWENVETITRTKDNNPKGEEEDANTCTGCKPRTCAVCHSADPATGFIEAEGTPMFDPGHTFAETKKISPPYLQKYIGLDTNGDPRPSHGIRMKSDNTVNVAKAYQHPMFKLTPEQEAAIDDFVNDAITRYESSECGKPK